LNNGIRFISILRCSYAKDKKKQRDADEWEATQRSMIQSTYGAQDKKNRGDEYDLIQLDVVDFVESLVNKGVNIEKLMEENKKRDEALSTATSEYEKIQIQRASLPVMKCRKQILEYVKNYQIIIVEAETGSGKTTQIPQFLMEAG
jgi:pre-mRNA-splicing factor ATP-dependent RNA helicase DHX16